jgi:hypothetical protein
LFFTAGIDKELHGLFGSLTAVAPGTPEGPAEKQAVVAALDVVQLDLAKLTSDISSGAPQSTVDQDRQTLKTDIGALVLAQQQFAQDSGDDRPANDEGASSGTAASARDAVFADLGSLDLTGSRDDQRTAARPATRARHAAATQNIDPPFATDWDLDS